MGPVPVIFQKRLHGGGHVAAVLGQDLRAVLAVDGGGEARGLEVRPHDFFRHPNTERGVRADQSRRRERTLYQLTVVDHLENQAHALGLGRVEGSPGQHQLERARRTDEARQEIAHADVAARESDADERHREHCRARGDSHVGTEGESEAAAGRRPVDGGDDWLGERAHARHQPCDELLELHPRPHALGGRRAEAAECLEVEPCAEAATVTGEDHDPTGTIRRDGLERGVQIDDAVEVDRVQALGLREREDPDAVLDVFGTHVSHPSFLLSPARPLRRWPRRRP